MRRTPLIFMVVLAGLMACSNDDNAEPDDAVSNTNNNTGSATTLHPAFAEFNQDNTDIYIEDGDVVIETNGLPDHPSFYWGPDSDLYEDPSNPDLPVRDDRMTIADADNAAVIRLPLTPTLAAEPSATNLGTIGIGVSGAAIFNEQEGNGPLSEDIASGLDTSGGHIGPSVYHYHLEPSAISDDDDKLVGVLADGFFIYGRKCNSTGTYPTDLDESGGHTHTTQHSIGDEYHYHIVNELYLSKYYLLFGGDFQGVVGDFGALGGDTGNNSDGGGMMGGGGGGMMGGM